MNMFSLRRLKAQEIIKINKFKCRSSNCKNFAWSAFSWDSYPVVTKKLTNCLLQRLVSCKYSNNADELEKSPEDTLSSQINVRQKNEIDTEAVFAEIANGDAQILRKLKLLEFEIEVFRQSDQLIPSSLKEKEWKHLLTLNSVGQRKKYLLFLFKNEKKSENKKLKKELLKEKYLKMKEEGLGGDIMEYSLTNQALLQRIYSKSLNRILTFKNHIFEETAQQFIFDCSYQEYMNDRNSKLCALQFRHCLNLHMQHQYPNLIGLYNLKKTDYLYSVLPNYVLQINNTDFTWPIHEESYLNFYPKDRLVYLTPHCNNPLFELNPDDIYIIGAFVDKGCGVKASLAKAKKNKIRMARLPLDEHVRWKQGQKSLPLNIVLSILLDMKLYNDWSIALKNLPSRQYDGDFSE